MPSMQPMYLYSFNQRPSFYFSTNNDKKPDNNDKDPKR